MPPQSLADFGTTVIEELSYLDLRNLDVIYVAGLPERVGTRTFASEDRGRFRIDKLQASQLTGNALIMSPLPRVDEIAVGVDELPQAIYFYQSALGLPVRMAVLEHVSGRCR